MKKGKKYIIALLFAFTLFFAYGVSTVAYATAAIAPDSINGYIELIKQLSWEDTVPLSIVVPLIVVIALLFILLIASKGKSSRRAGRGSGAYSSQIVQSITDPIIGLNKNGNITFVNPATLSLFEVKEQELLGKKLHTVLCFKTSGVKCLDAQCPAKDALRSEFPSTVKSVSNVSNFS